MSTTSHHNPDAVLNELTRALMFKVVILISFEIWGSIGDIGYLSNVCVLHIVY